MATIVATVMDTGRTRVNGEAGLSQGEKRPSLRAVTVSASIRSRGSGGATVPDTCLRVGVHWAGRAVG
jgi:hypothetical protein